MTANIVRSWTGTITHITDDTENQTEVLTRCGRWLKNFHLGYPGETRCHRCGSDDDFDAVSEAQQRARLEEKRQREVRDREREARKAQRLKRHRQIMSDFELLIDKWGGEIIENRRQAAGGSIEFEIDGLKFRLSGNIF